MGRMYVPSFADEIEKNTKPVPNQESAKSSPSPLGPLRERTAYHRTTGTSRAQGSIATRVAWK